MIMRLTRYGTGFTVALKRVAILVLVLVPLFCGWIAGVVVKTVRLWRAAFMEGFEAGSQ